MHYLYEAVIIDINRGIFVKPELLEFFKHFCLYHNACTFLEVDILTNNIE